jgi:hypothetical protein
VPSLRSFSLLGAMRATGRVQQGSDALLKRRSTAVCPKPIPISAASVPLLLTLRIPSKWLFALFGGTMTRDASGGLAPLRFSGEFVAPYEPRVTL